MSKKKLPSRLEITKSAAVNGGPSINLRRRASAGEVSGLNINVNAREMLGRKNFLAHTSTGKGAAQIFSNTGDLNPAAGSVRHNRAISDMQVVLDKMNGELTTLEG